MVFSAAQHQLTFSQVFPKQEANRKSRKPKGVFLFPRLSPSCWAYSSYSSSSCLLPLPCAAFRVHRRRKTAAIPKRGRGRLLLTIAIDAKCGSISLVCLFGHFLHIEYSIMLPNYDWYGRMKPFVSPNSLWKTRSVEVPCIPLPIIMPTRVERMKRILPKEMPLGDVNIPWPEAAVRLFQDRLRDKLWKRWDFPKEP